MYAVCHATVVAKQEFFTMALSLIHLQLSIIPHPPPTPPSSSLFTSSLPMIVISYPSPHSYRPYSLHLLLFLILSTTPTYISMFYLTP